MTKRIGEIAKKSPALARALEALFLGFIISVLWYISFALKTGDFSDWRIVLSGYGVVLVTGISMAISKKLRDRQKELLKKNEELERARKTIN